MKDTETSRRSLLLGMSALPVLAVAGQSVAADLQKTTAAVGGGAVGTGAVAERGALVKPTVQAPRGARGIFTRLPDLDLESQQEYIWGRARWGMQITRTAEARGQEILRANGIDPTKPTDMKTQDIAELLHADPVIARASRLGNLNNYDTFATLSSYFNSKGSYYHDMLAASDKQGPGALVMNPGLDIPEYTMHEIHNQRGGYMGDPFAGFVYFYGTQVLSDGSNEQDTTYDRIAASIPLPADGKVRRILDQGCGPGQLASALKRRFPDAEVWGLDVSGPILRFAHMRDTQMNLGVNYAHQLAEDNRFPDNHFDIITSVSFHHELTAEASKGVFKEVHRVLRPGGVYRPADSGINARTNTPHDKLGHYIGCRVNHEVWTLEWSDMDRLGAMRSAGLIVDPMGIPGVADGGHSWWLSAIRLIATKA